MWMGQAKNKKYKFKYENISLIKYEGLDIKGVDTAILTGGF